MVRLKRMSIAPNRRVNHENGNVVFFDTKELAMAACQKHSEKK